MTNETALEPILLDVDMSVEEYDLEIDSGEEAKSGIFSRSVLSKTTIPSG